MPTPAKPPSPRPRSAWHNAEWRGPLKMKAATILCSVAALLTSPLAAAAPQACDTLAVSVKRLGKPSPESRPDEDVIQELHRCATAAAPLLLAELRVIDPERVNTRWTHMVATERALRSITGQYFRFHSQQALGSLGEYSSRDTAIGYVSEWMSRGRIYVAPRDVQAKVIRAWGDWLEANPDFTAPAFQPYGDWYW